MIVMTFKGWPVEAVEFYEGLQADNTKTYWEQHKSVYEQSVKRPMEELLAEIADDFGTGRMFRPYRDVRFSKDKTPYKTAIYATLESGGYVGFRAEGLTVGRGYYRMAPDQIERYRVAVADDKTGPDLVATLAKLAKSQVTVEGSESLRSAPRGYPKDHPRIDLLRHRGLFAWRSWPVGAWLGTAAAKKRVVDMLHAAQPLQTWLDDRVGRSEAQPEDF
jgi:uncharacterized protein (TIGR02453 family)